MYNACDCRVYCLYGYRQACVGCTLDYRYYWRCIVQRSDCIDVLFHLQCSNKKPLYKFQFIELLIFVGRFSKVQHTILCKQSRVFLQSKKVKSSKICYSFIMSKKSLREERLPPFFTFTTSLRHHCKQPLQLEHRYSNNFPLILHSILSMFLQI